MRWLGIITGHIVRLWSSNWNFIRGCLLAFVVVMALTPVVQYWLKYTPIPDVPVSTIALLIAASLFLLAFTAMVYVALHYLRQIAETDRIVSRVRENKRRQYQQTEGTFIPTSDELSWQQEELTKLNKAGFKTDGIDLLRDKGILTDSDKEALQEMAFTAALRNQGRTE